MCLLRSELSVSRSANLTVTSRVEPSSFTSRFFAMPTILKPAGPVALKLAWPSPCFDQPAKATVAHSTQERERLRLIQDMEAPKLRPAIPRQLRLGTCKTRVGEVGYKLQGSTWLRCAGCRSPSTARPPCSVLPLVGRSPVGVARYSPLHVPQRAAKGVVARMASATPAA
jgi:hypothetical protein